MILGFPPIMQGQGEPGVRAGSHANTLMKTASPDLRDRSLLVEQQCAAAADLTLTLMELKEERFYWTKADNPIKDIEETKFLLSDVSDDWRVTVDSHSSSPIFADENTQLVLALNGRGIVDGEYVINNTDAPNKETAIQAFRKKQEGEKQMFEQLLKIDPEGGDQVNKQGRPRSPLTQSVHSAHWAEYARSLSCGVQSWIALSALLCCCLDSGVVQHDLDRSQF